MIRKASGLLQVRTVKYGITGTIGTVLHWGILIGLVEAIRLDPVLSSTVGFVVTVVVSFVINSRWTFSIVGAELPNRRKVAVRFMKYVTVSLMGLILNTTVMFLFVHILIWPYLLGQSVALVAVPLSNYLLNLLWTFKA